MAIKVKLNLWDVKISYMKDYRLWRKDWNCSKLIKTGRLRIHYHETHYDKGFQGKLQSIGAVKFN